MNYLYTSRELFVGFMLPVQVGINAELARFINSPVYAALISFVVGSVCLGASLLLFKMMGHMTAMPA
jgi:bacterial/archaeal transporter family-2 protein